MAKDLPPRWDLEWLQERSEEELKALSSRLFTEMGYAVSPSDSQFLDFILSQDEPLAPDVGLRSSVEASSVEIPSLKEIDAAVANNAYAYGVVVITEEFNQAQKMFADGKRLQLLGGEEFLHKLHKLPKAKQDEFVAEFGSPAASGLAAEPAPAVAAPAAAPDATPEAPAPAAAGPTQPTPAPTQEVAPPQANPVEPAAAQVIEATVQVPVAQPEATPTPETSSVENTSPANPPKEGSGSDAPQLGTPTFLTKLEVPASADSPDATADSGTSDSKEDSTATSNAPSGGGGLPPLAQILPTVAAPAAAPAESSPPVENQSPAAGAPAEANLPDRTPISASNPSGPAGAEAAAPSVSQPATPPPLPTSPPGTSTPPQDLPAATSAEGASGTPNPAPGDPNVTSQGSGDQTAVNASSTPGGSGEDYLNKVAAESAISASGTGAASILRSGGLSGSAPSVSSEADAEEEKAEEASGSVGTEEPPQEENSSSGPNKKTLIIGAVAAVLVLGVVGFGAMLLLKAIFGGNEAEVAETPSTEVAAPAPPDPKEIASLQKELRALIANLKHVDTQVKARANALDLAELATNARESGLEFKVKASPDVPTFVKAVVDWKLDEVSASKIDARGKFDRLTMSKAEQAEAVNYLYLDEGVLKFVLSGNEPTPPKVSRDELPENQELLVELEDFLNARNVKQSQKNALAMIEVAERAQESGLDFVATSRHDPIKIAARIAAGETVRNYQDTGEDRFFGLPGISRKAQSAAAYYLKAVDGTLQFEADPDPAPEPEFDFTGDDLVYDLRHAASIAEKAIDHIEGKIDEFEPRAAVLAEKQESIIALTGEPVEIPFAGGKLSVSLPRDFAYEHEDQSTLLIVPKYSKNEGAAWLRLKLEARLDGSGGTSTSGEEHLRSIAYARGRPIEIAGGKAYYWKNEEIHDGANLYWLTRRHLGFGNSLVVVTDAIAQGQEDVPDVQRLREILPGIMTSLREVKKSSASATTPPATEDVVEDTQVATP